MKPKQLLDRVKEIFFEKLEAKNSWGKNELKQLYTEAMNEALMEAID